MSKNLVSLLFLFISIFMKAQDTFNQPQMADTMRSNGKIYVVISVIALIFLSLVYFLVRMDKKVKKLEDKLNEKGN